MKCPRCGLEQPQNDECRGCGIIIARYLQKQAAASRPQAPPNHRRTWYPPLARDKELRGWYNAQSQLLRAGLPPSDAHRNFIAGKPAIRDMTPYRRIELALNAGQPISAGMAQSPDYFPPHHTRVIAAGEASGNPAQSFDELYNNVDRRIRTLDTIRKSLRKPGLTLASSFFVMPLPDLFTSGVPGYLEASLLPFSLLLIGTLGVWQIGRMVINRASLGLLADHLLLHVPVYRTFVINQFIRVLRALYAAGIDLPSAFATAASTSGNRYLEDRLADGEKRLGQGESLTLVTRATGVFPGDLQQFIASGEASGSLEVSLERYLQIAEERFDRQMAHTGTWLSFTIGAIVSVYVGYQIVQGFRADLPKVPIPAIQQ